MEAAHPRRIILFGSRARGEAHEDSDVDLLVVLAEVKDRVAGMVRLTRVLRGLVLPAELLVVSQAMYDSWSEALLDSILEDRTVSAEIFGCHCLTRTRCAECGMSSCDPHPFCGTCVTAPSGAACQWSGLRCPDVPLLTELDKGIPGLRCYKYAAPDGALPRWRLN
ncbi:MAG: nucleotidyltransferase domain-containing protein [Verrucomicrobiota bacterium]